jgi:cupin fold WbuC family metalloprotein
MPMIIITEDLLDETSDRARRSLRKRMNHNFHQRYDDPLQRLLNAVEPGTYLRPHKHENPDKTEIFIILRGKVLIIEFDDDGEIQGHVILDNKKGKRGVEIPPRVWHSFIALEEGSVLYEIKEGPYIENGAKSFARWAPEEGSKEAEQFNQEVLRRLHIQVSQ